MSDKLRIAFTGIAGSGKTTAARVLENEFGFRRTSIATPVKILTGLIMHTIDDFIGWTPSWTEGEPWTARAVDDAKRDNPGIRSLLQVVGTDIGREMYGRDVWVNQVSETLDRSSLPRIVVDDLRFPNEADVLRESDFIIIRLERDEHDWTAGAAGDRSMRIAGHVSEIAMQEIEPDYTVSAGSVGELEESVRGLVQSLIAE